MRSMLDFHPTFTTAEAFADFGSRLPPTGGRTEKVLANLAAALPPVPKPPSSIPSTRLRKEQTMADAEIIPIGTGDAPAAAPASSPPPRLVAASAGKPPAPAQEHAAQGHAAQGRQRRPPRDGRRRSVSPARSSSTRSSRRRTPAAPTHRRGPPPRDPCRGAARRVPARRQGSSGTSGTQLARFLAFLRRRITGDYVVDEYGFDQEVTQRFLMTALRPIAEKWFRIEVRGAENIPTGRRPGRLQPLRHGPHGRPDDDGLDPRPHRPVPATARRGPDLPDAAGQHDGPQGRRHAGLQRGRRADARRR